MYVRNRDKIRKHRHGRHQMSVTVTYTPSDIKKALQRHLKELQLYGFENKFDETGLKEFFRQRVFNLLPDKHAVDFADWAYDVSIANGYVTSNSWDRERPTLYFIPLDILKLRPGPTGPRTVRGKDMQERKLKKEKENENEEL